MRTHTHNIAIYVSAEKMEQNSIIRHKGPSEVRMGLTVFDVDVFVGKCRRSYFATHF